jgi:hypothetical protein
MHQPGAQDAEADFLTARDRGVEDGRGCVHAGKTNYCRSVSGEHERIGARCRVQQREHQAECDPERESEAEQWRRVDEIGQHRNGEGAPGEGAGQPPEPLGARCPGKGLGGDVDRGNGPVGARQVQAEGDVQGERGGDKAFQREQPSLGRWEIHAALPSDAAGHPAPRLPVA